MLTSSKKKKLLANLKAFQRKYFGKKLGELDESGTRLLVNDLLCMVLGYVPIEEIKTEYMIRGTYADYMIAIKGNRHFLVEVKSLGLNLSDKHLRQVIEYGANEGVDWAVLTNGREVQLYRIVFEKPIDSKLVFKVNVESKESLKDAVDKLQHLHRESVVKKGLDLLWNRFQALETFTIAGLLYDNSVLNFLRRALKRKFKNKFEKEEIKNALTQVICMEVDMERVKMISSRKAKSKAEKKRHTPSALVSVPLPGNPSIN